MSIFKVGGYVRHQADERLEFKVVEVKCFEDEDGSPTWEVI